MLNLKNGTAIDVKDKEAKLKLKHKRMSNLIVYYEDVNIEKTVLLSDIAWLKIEILESNQIATVLVVIGTVAAAILLAFWLILATGGLKM